MTRKSLVLASISLLTLSSIALASPETELREVISQKGLQDNLMLPVEGDLDSIPQDPKNPLTDAKVRLGKMLFFETGLTLNCLTPVSDKTFSCASCHGGAKSAFTSGNLQAIAEGGIGFGERGEGREPNPHMSTDDMDVLPLKAPMNLNVAYHRNVLWNGSLGAGGINTGLERYFEGLPHRYNKLGFHGVETQAIAGLEVHRIANDQDLASKVKLKQSVVAKNGTYKRLFAEAYPSISEKDRVSQETIALSIAAYERAMLANRAPFQKWLRGEEHAMSDSQKRGALLFMTKGRCLNCHNGPALGGGSFHALGMLDFDERDTIIKDKTRAEKLGRASFSKNKQDSYKFKTPGLYNIKDHHSFGHGGSLKTIEDVVEYKIAARSEHPEVTPDLLSSEFRPLNLTDREKADLIEFLKEGLYDPELERYEPKRIPSGLCFPNNDPLSRAQIEHCQG